MSPAGFLRALEFYDGILFLTTNRVGSFDDAFMSRVHVQLHYPKFTDEQRQQLWKTFTGKLVRERGDYMRLNIDAKEYIGSAEVRALEWNGREIRNGEHWVLLREGEHALTHGSFPNCCCACRIRSRQR